MRVIGLSCAVPANRVSSSDFLSHFNQETVEKIVENTGIQERRLVRNFGCTSDLCLAAAEELFQQTLFPKESVDAVVFVSQTTDYFVPATSCIVQSKLGLPETVFTFDVNQGCTGYTDGLIIAQGLLRGLGMKCVLLLVGDTPSRGVNPDDQGTAMLFGDAGAATLLEATDTPFHHVVGTDGTGALVIHSRIGYRNGLAMSNPMPTHEDLAVNIDGAKVYEFTIDRVPGMVKELMKKVNWSVDQVGAFVFHQANQYIMRNLARMTKIPMDKLPISLDEFGNTSSASIPLTMVTRMADLLKNPTKLVLVGFGVGLAWSAVALEWRDAHVCPLVELDC